MTNQPHLTDTDLELATSRSPPPTAEPTSDAAAAREAFLSLGATLESATNDFDEAAFFARLQKSCLDAPVPASRFTQPRRNWLSLVLGGALAAAALVAIVRIASESNQTLVPIAKIDVPAPALAAPSIESRPATQFIASNDSLRWNDPLDDEIAVASATLEQFATKSRGFDDSLFDMSDQLRSLSDELTNETL